VTPTPACARSLALVGFMGAGKSRIGRLVAQRLGIPFVDTDEVISARHGAIADLFAERGEEGFRAIEGAVVLDELHAAEEGARVVALGGGAVTIDEVRAALRRLPHVVWLDAPPRVLFARTRTSARPLAHDEALFAALYEARRPLYDEAATQVVRTAGHERLAWVADKVLAAVAA
jgi:shikimate kinase